MRRASESDNSINKSIWIKQIQLLTVLSLLSGCLIQEDRGTIENIGTPTEEPADFTVDEPEPLPPVADQGESDSTSNNAPISEQGDFWMIVEEGREFTTSPTGISIDLGTTHSSFLWYKLLKNTDCAGGIWTPLPRPELRQTVVTSEFDHNALNSYSVQYLDVDGLTSPCLSDSVIQDDAGPNIIFSKYPSASNEEGATGTIEFTVSDVSGLQDVICTLKSEAGEIAKKCHEGLNSIQLSAMPVGQFSLEVAATDNLGHQNAQGVSWSVVSTAKILTQTVGIVANKKVDILFVIDNSGSMGFEQKSMASRVRNMLSIVKDLDYRIAVTTTDPRATSSVNGKTYYGDGDLIPIYGLSQQYWIDSNMNQEEAQKSLGQTLQRSETGWPYEQGIRSVSRFLTKFGMNSSNLQSQFLRADANFAVVVISDEDESDSKPENNPENLMNQIHDKYDGQKAFSWHSIITIPKDQVCLYDNGAAYGEIYNKLSQLTGGIVGSVCASDYANQVTKIASEITDLIKIITLSCEPLPSYPVTVTKDGIAFSGNFTIEGRNLKFDEALDVGEYKINFACLNQ